MKNIFRLSLISVVILQSFTVCAQTKYPVDEWINIQLIDLPTFLKASPKSRIVLEKWIKTYETKDGSKSKLDHFTLDILSKKEFSHKGSDLIQQSLLKQMEQEEQQIEFSSKNQFIQESYKRRLERLQQFRSIDDVFTRMFEDYTNHMMTINFHDWKTSEYKEWWGKNLKLKKLIPLDNKESEKNKTAVATAYNFYIQGLTSQLKTITDKIDIISKLVKNQTLSDNQKEIAQSQTIQVIQNTPSSGMIPMRIEISQTETDKLGLTMFIAD